jgi:hypothetical protein
MIVLIKLILAHLLGDFVLQPDSWVKTKEERNFKSIVVSNHWEAIGFLMAAKSVFRFGDLKESTDRKLTEYILIGTFVSFGLAILTGILYIQIIN